MSESKHTQCKTCDGVKVVHSGEPTMYNCELGGEDCSGMTAGKLDNPDACKVCGKTVPCPECMPVANEYYHLWHRDLRQMNINARQRDALLAACKKAYKEIGNIMDLLNILDLLEDCNATEIRTQCKLERELETAIELAEKEG